MGGRGAHESRIKGRIPKELQEYHTTGIITTTIDGKECKIFILLPNDPKIRPRLPEFSNSPNAFYGLIDPDTGKLEKVREYVNNRTVCDYEYHKTKSPNVPMLHKHVMTFPTTEELKKMTPEAKRKGAHGGKHENIAPEDFQRLGNILNLLGKFPQDISEYSEWKGE